MRGLPIEHTYAQRIYSELQQKQLRAIRDLPPEEATHRIEVAYDLKQELSCILIQCEKRLAMVHRKSEEDDYDMDGPRRIK